MEKIKRIYDVLYSSFGPQKWWPTTLEGELHPTYHGKKINDNQRFEIIIGAILTQNTSWKNVEKAIFNLNKKKVLSIEKIKKTDQKKLAQMIRPSGYYNQKSERLKIVAEFFSRCPIKDFKKINTEKAREILLSTKGIGPETADSILLYAFDKPIFVIDAYTKRIFSRIDVCKEKCSYDDLQEIFHTSLSKRYSLFNEYHALIVELAKRNCMKTPECRSCPIKNLCSKKFG